MFNKNVYFLLVFLRLAAGALRITGRPVRFRCEALNSSSSECSEFDELSSFSLSSPSGSSGTGLSGGKSSSAAWSREAQTSSADRFSSAAI